MVRKIVVAALALFTVGFMLMTITRMQIDYNEEGNYFDGLVNYHEQAIAGYGVLTAIFFTATIFVLIATRNNAGEVVVKGNVNYGDALCFVLAPIRTKEIVYRILNSFISGYEKCDSESFDDATTGQTFANEDEILSYLEANKHEYATLHWNKDHDNPDRVMAGAYFTRDGKLIFSLTLPADGRKEEKFFTELQKVLNSDIGVIFYNKFPEFEDGDDFRRKCLHNSW